MSFIKINEAYLVRTFDDLNERYFKGKLPFILIVFVSFKQMKQIFGTKHKAKKSIRGFFKYASNGSVMIGITKDYKNTFAILELRQTVLHEMVHYYFYLRKGKTYRAMVEKKGGHTIQFKNKLKRLSAKDAKHLIKDFTKSVKHSFIH